jgi:hypothetical protein
LIKLEKGGNVDYLLLLTYPILGAGLKYIDDAFDIKIFDISLAIVLAPVLSIIGAYSMVINSASATILLAILGGVLLKGKIDNIAFIIGFLLAIMLAILTFVQFLILPFIMLTAGALLDEIGNDYIDGNNDKLNTKNPLQLFAKYFLGHRWIMKIVILYLVILNYIPLILFFAMILFDYAYLCVNAYSKRKLEKKNATITV